MESFLYFHKVTVCMYMGTMIVSNITIWGDVYWTINPHKLHLKLLGIWVNLLSWMRWFVQYDNIYIYFLKTEYTYAALVLNITMTHIIYKFLHFCKGLVYMIKYSYLNINLSWDEKEGELRVYYYKKLHTGKNSIIPAAWYTIASPMCDKASRNIASFCSNGSLFAWIPHPCSFYLHIVLYMLYSPPN